MGPFTRNIIPPKVEPSRYLYHVFELSQELSMTTLARYDSLATCLQEGLFQYRDARLRETRDDRPHIATPLDVFEEETVQWAIHEGIRRLDHIHAVAQWQSRRAQ